MRKTVFYNSMEIARAMGAPTSRNQVVYRQVRQFDGRVDI
jgi:hypothetical protein